MRLYGWNGSRSLALSALLALSVGGLSSGCGNTEEAPRDNGPGWTIGEKPAEDMAPPVDMTPPVDMAPPVDMTPPVFKQTGEACAEDTECIGGTCLKGDAWPGGYCAQGDNCAREACAAQGGACEMNDDLVTRCVVPCVPGGPAVCREGYECRVGGEGSDPACLVEVPKPEGADDGEACDSDRDCASGVCITEDQGFPGGYCTTPRCTDRDDCANYGGSDNRCLRQSRPPICVRMCTSPDDCREGYACEPVGQGLGICMPDESVPFTEDLSSYPFPITCSQPAAQEVSIPVTIAADSTSHMVVPFTRDGGQLLPDRLNQPDGTVHSFRGDLAFMSLPAQVFETLNPLVFPPTSDRANMLQAGANTVDLRTNSQDLCVYQLSETTPGTTIDLNVYLVGLDNISAASAAMDPNLSAMLAEFDARYAQAGITRGKTRFFELPADQAQQFRVITSDAQMMQLVALSKRPGDTYDDTLSMNVFFVPEMQRGGAIGTSLGLPGPAGLHGTGNSGVVFTAEFLGRDFQEQDGSIVNGNKFTGLVLAHEVGHYLGLFHTTEQDRRTTDPIADTPDCLATFPNNCPDVTNLMFPFAGITHTELSPGQAHVIQANPLTKD